MPNKIKQPTHCPKCGTELTIGECGPGFCSKCKTYTMRIQFNCEIKGALT